MGKVEDQIVEILQKSKRPLTLAEIAEDLRKPHKKAFSPLRKLFEEGKVDFDIHSRTYKLTKE